MRNPVAVLGASVRSIAQSAHRAGHDVIAVDLFGDRDLRAVARQVITIDPDQYPHAMTQAAVPYGIPWTYTGGLENHTRLLDELASKGPLWGNGSKAIQSIRDPFALRDKLLAAGFRFPRTLTRDQTPPNSEWLIKRNTSTGGLGVRRYEPSGLERNEYLQEFIPGTPYSALFVGFSKRSVFLGASRQLLKGHTHPGICNNPWQYVGSVRPRSHPGPFQTELIRLGNLLVTDLSLQGVFGVDFIDADGELVIIEVNPRWTASVEIFERALGVNLFSLHRAACTGESIPGDSISGLPSYFVWAKRILFAPGEGRILPNAPCYALREPDDPTPLDYADIPEATLRIARDQPILTLIASDTTEERVMHRLAKAEEEFLSRWFSAG